MINVYLLFSYSPVSNTIEHVARTLRFESYCLKTHGKLLSAVKDEWVGTPDFTLVDAAKALKKGKVTVYSSYPIENGAFVTPSKMEAESYAGGGKVYSKDTNLDDVAWIDSNEGQVAMVPEGEV